MGMPKHFSAACDIGHRLNHPRHGSLIEHGGGIALSSTYADLEVWRTAMELVVRIYQLSQRFPKEEIYGLTSQLRRAAVSVASNIAEGKGRASDKELIQFLCHSRGSLFEIETQLAIAARLNYVKDEECEPLKRECARVGQMLNGLIRSVRPAA
jgi:four helix bundle protein